VPSSPTRAETMPLPSTAARPGRLGRLALAALLALAARPAPADEIYTFVDRDGVVHVTNVPEDRRYRRARWSPPPEPGVRRVVLNGRRASPAPAVARAGSATTYEEHIQAAAGKYRLPPPLLKAVMAAESNFDPRAVSERGAQGLMQLMPATAWDLSVENPYDPGQNIEGGARYLRLLSDRYGGDLERTLAAYNAGPEAVRRARGAVPDIPETRAYVRKVISLYEGYLRGR
jgi:soluble lytic murein transglycosylase-like protein